MCHMLHFLLVSMRKKQSTNVEQPIVISTSDNKENEPIVNEYSVDPGTSTSPEPNDTEHQNSEKHDQVSREITNDMCV